MTQDNTRVGALHKEALIANGLSFSTIKTKLLVVFKMLALVLSICGITSVANAAIEVYEFDNPRQEAQYKGLIEEFRCPKCQNQNLAGSDSQIAQDLKRKTYEMVMAGQTDAQIREYMYERYGDFISYKPPVRPSTWILWYFPPVFLILVVGWWVLRSKRAKANQTVSASTAATQAEVDTLESDLSTEEAAKLEALLNKHNDNKKSPYHKDEHL